MRRGTSQGDATPEPLVEAPGYYLRDATQQNGRDRAGLGWEGTEHLKAGNVDYLAAFSAWLFDGIHISRMYWSGPDFTLRVPAVTGVDEVGARTASLRLRVLDFQPTAAVVRLELESPVAMPVKFEIFDLAGRRISTLANRTITAGTTLLKWDRSGHERGRRAPSGVYYARLSYASGARVARLPLVR